MENSVNGKMEDEYSTTIVSVEDAPGLHWPAPPPLTPRLHGAAAKFSLS